MIDDSFDLLVKLKELGYIKDETDPYWWPNSGTIESMVGAILTQNTKWQKVEKALENLRSLELLDIDKLIDVDKDILISAIKPSGFYNTKYKYIKLLAQNIKDEFGDFEYFRQEVSREWLLSQKGLGPESSDAILCYTCYHEEMVVDSYTQRLLSAIGYECESYDDVKDWCKCGINNNLDKIDALYNKKMNLHEIYARFHGKIVDFCKDNAKGKNIDITALG
jgi:endonuclease-3 related protein